MHLTATLLAAALRRARQLELSVVIAPLIRSAFYGVQPDSPARGAGRRRDRSGGPLDFLLLLSGLTKRW